MRSLRSWIVATVLTILALTAFARLVAAIRRGAPRGEIAPPIAALLIVLVLLARRQIAREVRRFVDRGLAPR
jgi:hypothetical protein